MNDDIQTKITYDECVAKGICSISPDLSYLQEVIREHIRELAFYLLKLKELGITNEKIKDSIIEIISGLILCVQYSEEQFIKIITRLSADLQQAKELYTTVCQKNHLHSEFIKTQIKLPKKITLSEAIKQGQKLFTSKFAQIDAAKKNLLELNVNIAKSICVNIIKLRNLDIDDESAYLSLLSLYNIRGSYSDVPIEKLHEVLNDCVELDHKLLMKVQEVREQRYGKLIPTSVNTSIKPGKAILVSGDNLRDLEQLLEATKDKGINIYTHGNMLMAHAYPKLKAYSHLIGHYGNGSESYLLDFSSFPGAIFLTRHSGYKVENLFRSRIYTTDVLAPKGVMTIKDKHFDSLIESTLHSKGFLTPKEKSPINLTLDESKIKEKMTEVAQKFKDGSIKHFIAIGVSNHTKKQKDYFGRFLKIVRKDCFITSLSYFEERDNIFFVESDYGFLFYYKALDVLREQMEIDYSKIIALYTRCDIHSVSNVLYVKRLGVNKIYFPECPPTLINPAIINAMKEIYDIKDYTTPEADLKAMLA